MAVRTRGGAQLAVVEPPEEVAIGEIVEELTTEQAEEVTRLIVGCLRNWYSFGQQITELALKAFHGQAFKVLGHETWNAYAAAKFGDLELPRATQAAINAALINTGEISARSAAAISGTSDKTAAADAAKARESTAENSAVGRKHTGADGKKRASKKRSRKVAPVRNEPQGNSDVQLLADTRFLAEAKGFTVDVSSNGVILLVSADDALSAKTMADAYALLESLPEAPPADAAEGEPGCRITDPWLWTCSSMSDALNTGAMTADAGLRKTLRQRCLTILKMIELESTAEESQTAAVKDEADRWDEILAKLEQIMQRGRKRPATYFDDKVAKLLNLAMSSDSEDEAVSAFLFARKAFRS